MRILAIDYGIKRIGLAVSDPLGLMALPLDVIERRTLREDIEKISALAREKGAERVVVGLPLNMDGTPGILTEEVRAFGKKIGEKSGIPVEFYDERLTTYQAERLLADEADISREKRKKVRDKIAASFILQAYLDTHTEKKR